MTVETMTAAEVVDLSVTPLRELNAALHAVEQRGNERRLAAGIAERHGIAFSDIERGGIQGVDHHARLALAGLR